MKDRNVFAEGKLPLSPKDHEQAENCRLLGHQNQDLQGSRHKASLFGKLNMTQGFPCISTFESPTREDQKPFLHWFDKHQI